MVFEFIDPDNQKWIQALKRIRHDIYHLPEYVTFAANHEGGTPTAFFAEVGTGYCLIPLSIRPIPYKCKMTDASAPYGYASPIISSEMRAIELDTCLREFADRAAQLGLVSVFLRLHPLLSLNLETLSQHGQVQFHGPTVYVDLTLSFDTLWNKIRDGHQANIRTLQTQGFQVEIDNWERLDNFVRIYKSTMERVNAGQFYKFSWEYFEKLRSSIGSKLHIFSVISPTGEYSAGALFTEHEGIVEYHLSGTDINYIKSSPSKLMLYEAIKWAKAREDRYLHLGGGQGAKEDTLYAFKAGFSDKRSKFYTYRMIVRPQLYQQLCDNWQQTTGIKLPATDFFPLYRHPH